MWPSINRPLLGYPRLPKPSLLTCTFIGLASRPFRPFTFSIPFNWKNIRDTRLRIYTRKGFRLLPAAGQFYCQRVRCFSLLITKGARAHCATARVNKLNGELFSSRYLVETCAVLQTCRNGQAGGCAEKGLWCILPLNMPRLAKRSTLYKGSREWKRSAYREAKLENMVYQVDDSGGELLIWGHQLNVCWFKFGGRVVVMKPWVMWIFQKFHSNYWDYSVFC